MDPSGNICLFDKWISLDDSLHFALWIAGLLKQTRRHHLLTISFVDTSRPPQAGEVDGVDYHFYSSKAAMQVDISSGKFLDVAVQSDHFYATSLQSILEVLQSGRICILDVNVVAIYRLQVGASSWTDVSFAAFLSLNGSLLILTYVYAYITFLFSVKLLPKYRVF